jgi:hypothetical protein
MVIGMSYTELPIRKCIFTQQLDYLYFHEKPIGIALIRVILELGKNSQVGHIVLVKVPNPSSIPPKYTLRLKTRMIECIGRGGDIYRYNFAGEKIEGQG